MQTPAKLKQSRRKLGKLDLQQPTMKRNASNVENLGMFERTARARTIKILETTIQLEVVEHHVICVAKKGMIWPVEGRNLKIPPSAPNTISVSFHLMGLRKR